MRLNFLLLQKAALILKLGSPAFSHETCARAAESCSQTQAGLIRLSSQTEAGLMKLLPEKMSEQDKSNENSKDLILSESIHIVYEDIAIIPGPAKLTFCKLKCSKEGHWIANKRKLAAISLVDFHTFMYALLIACTHLSYTGPKLKLQQNWNNLELSSNIEDGQFVICLSFIVHEKCVHQVKFQTCDAIITFVRCVLTVAPLAIRQGDSFVEQCAEFSCVLFETIKMDGLFDLVKQLISRETYFKLSLLQPYIAQYFSTNVPQRLQFEERLRVHKSYFLCILIATMLTYKIDHSDTKGIMLTDK